MYSYFMSSDDEKLTELEKAEIERKHATQAEFIARMNGEGACSSYSFQYSEGTGKIDPDRLRKILEGNTREIIQLRLFTFALLILIGLVCVYLNRNGTELFQDLTKRVERLEREGNDHD